MTCLVIDVTPRPNYIASFAGPGSSNPAEFFSSFTRMLPGPEAAPSNEPQAPLAAALFGGPPAQKVCGSVASFCCIYRGADTCILVLVLRHRARPRPNSVPAPQPRANRRLVWLQHVWRMDIS